MLREVDEAIVVLDDAGRVRVLGAGAEALFGLSIDEALGRPFADLFGGATFVGGGMPSRGPLEPMHDPRSGERTVQTAVVTARDGRQTPIEYRAVEVQGDGDAPSQTLIVMRRLNDRRPGSQQLPCYPSLAAALRGSGIGVWIVDMRNGLAAPSSVQLFNFWELLGYDRPPGPPDIAGILELAHPEDLDSVRRAISPQFIGNRRKHYLEARYRHRDGSYRWLLQRSHTEFSTAGIPVRLVGSSVDITERICAEAALREANSVVAAANSAKDRFIASIGHELRTPLNGILGYAHLLRVDASMTPRQQRAVVAIERNGDLLLSLINDILDVTSIEAGKGQLNVSRFSIDPFLRMVCGLVRLRLNARGLDFVCRLSSDVPAELNTDEGRLHRVLVDLLTHCASRLQHGQVTLDVGSHDNRSVRFEITRERIATSASDDDKESGDGQYQPEEGLLDAGASELALEISGRMVALLGDGHRLVEPTFGSDSYCFEVPAASLSVRVPKVRLANGYSGVTRSVLVIGDGAGVDALVRELQRLRFDVRQLDAVESSATIPAEVDAIICAGTEADCEKFWSNAGTIPGAMHAWYLLEPGENVVADACGVVTDLVDSLDIQLTLEDSAIAYEDPLPEDVALLVHPPADEVRALYAHALSGNMREVLAWAERMEGTLPALSAFSMRVRDFARHYDSQALVAFVERYLPTRIGDDKKG